MGLIYRCASKIVFFQAGGESQDAHVHTYVAVCFCFLALVIALNSTCLRPGQAYIWRAKNSLLHFGPEGGALSIRPHELCQGACDL